MRKNKIIEIEVIILSFILISLLAPIVSYIEKTEETYFLNLIFILTSIISLIYQCLIKKWKFVIITLLIAFSASFINNIITNREFEWKMAATVIIMMMPAVKLVEYHKNKDNAIRLKKRAISSLAFSASQSIVFLLYYMESDISFPFVYSIFFLWIFMLIVSGHYLIMKKIKENHYYYIASFLYFGCSTFVLREIIHLVITTEFDTEFLNYLVVCSAFIGIPIAFLQRHLFRNEKSYATC